MAAFEESREKATGIELQSLLSHDDNEKRAGDEDEEDWDCPTPCNPEAFEDGPLKRIKDKSKSKSTPVPYTQVPESVNVGLKWCTATTDTSWRRSYL